MNRAALHRLTTLLACPTAPFREEAVAAVVSAWLAHAGVPFFRDPVGNLVVGARSRAEYLRLIRRQSREPVRLFIAHMDHPGFHGRRWRSDRRLEVEWHGGSPVKKLAGAPVWLAQGDCCVAQGRLANVRLDAKRHALHRAEVAIEKPSWRERPAPEALFGAFRFRAPVWRAGKRLNTKAADDLVGVFAVVHTAMKLFAGRRRAPFLGLLTRAEEVGFVGAVNHFELGWLEAARRPVVCVSLETSRALPGARIGKGPVVRLGDRRTVFDAGGLRVLTELAQRVLPRRHQRRIMDGGTCEATAATAWGFPAIGLSVPLGNYHNIGDKTGAPAPEYVRIDDVEGMLRLCRALMTPALAWENAWADTRRALKRRARRYRRRLGRAAPARR
jgi:endoglucanase